MPCQGLSHIMTDVFGYPVNGLGLSRVLERKAARAQDRAAQKHCHETHQQHVWAIFRDQVHKRLSQQGHTSRSAMRRSSSDLRFSQGGMATTLLRARSGFRSRLMYSTARCCSSTSMNLHTIHSFSHTYNHSVASVTLIAQRIGDALLSELSFSSSWTPSTHLAEGEQQSS